jgi:hypothetical protein
VSIQQHAYRILQVGSQAWRQCVAGVCIVLLYHVLVCLDLYNMSTTIVNARCTLVHTVWHCSSMVLYACILGS